MGFFDFLKRNNAEVPSKFVTVSFRFIPMRLTANKRDYVNLNITIKNTTPTKQLVSTLITLPKGISFDGTGFSTTKEERLGTLAPGESKSLVLKIQGNMNTDPGTYKIRIQVLGHQSTYDYILYRINKLATLRVS